MSGNRVSEEDVLAMQDFANTYWPQLLDEARVLFSQKPPRPSDKDYYKALQFAHTAKKTLLANITTLAKLKSGAVHPVGANNESERIMKDQIIRNAMKNLGLPGGGAAMTITHYDAEDARRTEVTAGTIWFLTVDAAPAAARTTEHGGGVRILPVAGSDRQRIARLASRLNRLFSTERFGVARVNDWIMD